MTPEKETHLQIIKSNFDEMVDKKYRKGDKEHKDNLLDLTTKELVKEAIDECVDQYVFLMSIYLKLELENAQER